MFYGDSISSLEKKTIKKAKKLNQITMTNVLSVVK